MWCHMWADTEAELHRMARAIGLKREWFQDQSIIPHYDLIPRRRTKAIELGAREYPLGKWMRENPEVREERKRKLRSKKKGLKNS